MATSEPVRTQSPRETHRSLHAALMERVSDAVILIDDHQRIVAANSEACRLLQRSRDDATALRFHDLVDNAGAVLAVAASGDPVRCIVRTAAAHAVPCDITFCGCEHGLTQLILQPDRYTFGDEALRALMVGTATAVGDDFIRSLARHTALVLGYRYALVGDVCWEEPARVRVLAMWNEDRFEAPAEYLLAGTPCEQVLRGGAYFVPSGVAESYSTDRWLADIGAESYLGMPILDARGDAVGVISAIHTEAKSPEQDARPVLSIFAARAAAEFERKRAETALRHSESRFRTIYEQAPVMMHSLDDTCRICNVNETWLDELGYTREDVLGRPLVDFFTPSSRARLLDDVRARYFADGIVDNEDLQMVRNDGSIVDVLLGCHASTEPDGRRVGLSVVRNVTEQRRAQEAQLRLTAAIEQAAEAVVITDAEGIIQYVNPAFETITGYGRDECIGQTPGIFQSGHHGQDFYRDLWSTIRTGGTWSGRFTNRKKDGSVYQEDATISPVRDQRGTITNYVAVKRDITDELALETQLRQAQKMEAVGQLAGGIAHDFNNLLQAIMAHVSLARETVGLESDIAGDLQNIRNAAVQAASLTRQLLTFSRRQLLQSLDINLNDVVDHMLKMIARLIGDTINLQFEPRQDIGTVHADPHQVEQVLMNLCVNARDAMPRGGTIRIHTDRATLDAAYADAHPWARAGDYVVLTVADEGTGMDEATLARAFEPFFTTKQLGHGSGLGLATVYGIVKQHHGLVHIDSSPGDGTTIRVYLPVVDRPSEPVYAPTRTPLVGGTETILIAEDEEIVRTATVRVLERAGYRVVSASDGEEAVGLYRQHRDEIALGLFDIAMPRMGGIEAAREIRALNPDFPILFCSGYGAAHADTTGDDEPFDLVQKPCRPGDLLARLRDLLD